MNTQGPDEMTRVLMPIADGTEEAEAITTADLLRRASCVVCLASVDGETIVASRGSRIRADTQWDALRPAEYDAIVVPGGARGVERLSSHVGVLDALRVAANSGRWIGAICAGPLVLQAAGVLRGRMVTCHPAVASRIEMATRRSDPVVVDGHIITSQGVGTTVAFALTLIQSLRGSETAQQVASEIVAVWP